MPLSPFWMRRPNRTIHHPKQQHTPTNLIVKTQPLSATGKIQSARQEAAGRIRRGTLRRRASFRIFYFQSGFFLVLPHFHVASISKFTCLSSLIFYRIMSYLMAIWIVFSVADYWGYQHLLFVRLLPNSGFI